ncbi:isochorismatase family protein [Candidatus Woesearchaeota archaeon]|nr:isochorismatase family protein [Candidatus Woesearchaeota archaeon]
MVASAGLEAACAPLETILKCPEPSIQPQQTVPKSSEQFIQPPEQLPERKYAVLLIDATEYDNHDPKRWIKLEYELECMGKVLQEANRQGIPVAEITFVDCIVLHDWKAPCRDKVTDQDLAQYKDNNWIKIKKKYVDAFKETSLQQELSQREITDLIVMGFSQIACVQETVKTANKLGYRVHTSFDLIQEWASAKCELFVHGVSQSVNISNCEIKPNPASGVDVKRTEYDIENSRQFYRENTHLVGDYSQLPIFKH